ncbi:hypothetical protein R2R35_18420 [Anaerocolumna sp. AGMB13020]|uniref:hypothetical protein n=1 Tax=Anaerocolumna sp. AGMB13020 TaxID=3081750 RepID=UPI002952A6C1|nr:hypothetical protein [Anaerocolumna sp. AGMB13020]WOO35756.1 hypothetical protein R2R35_18420 [Anaerocolumna sp. AGMB13020]
MNSLFKGTGIVVLVIMSLLLIIYITPFGRGAINTYFFQVQKVDDITNYKTVKEVEDTCRAMISSYETDKLTYEQYKDSSNEEKQSWAEQAKMRANKTANSYNNYILKNSFIWEDNVPPDIKAELQILE